MCIAMVLQGPQNSFIERLNALRLLFRASSKRGSIKHVIVYELTQKGIVSFMYFNWMTVVHLIHNNIVVAVFSIVICRSVCKYSVVDECHVYTLVVCIRFYIHTHTCMHTYVHTHICTYVHAEHNKYWYQKDFSTAILW